MIIDKCLFETAAFVVFQLDEPYMGGAVFRPKDLTKGHRRVIENALKDINPDMKEEVLDLLSSWEGTASEQKLKERDGQSRKSSIAS